MIEKRWGEIKIDMNKIKEIVKSPLFHSAVAGGIGLVLLMESHPLYAGMGFGLAACKFLDAFK